MECPKCGNEVKDSEKKCPYCGKVLQLECPVCHKYNRSAICEECGNVIIVKCAQCGTIGPNTGKCRKCGFPTAKSVIINESETEEYACLAITFPNLEKLRPALKNKQTFNRFKKKLKQALMDYAHSQDNRLQLFGDTFVIKYYKEFSFSSSVKKAVKSAIELLNKIGGISYKLKRSKNVKLHCKMTILKKTLETDNNEFNTGLNIKLIKDTTVEHYTDGLQLITDQYVNNIISREYTLEMIYSSQVGDELLMFYEFPLEDQVIPIVIEEEKKKDGILTGNKVLPKLQIYDDDDQLDQILYGNKAIDISPESQFLSVPAHNIFNVLREIFKSRSFVTLKSTERRDLPTSDIKEFAKTISSNSIHIVCKEDFKYKPYSFFKELIASIFNIDLKQDTTVQKVTTNLTKLENFSMFSDLVQNTPESELDPDNKFAEYSNAFLSFLKKQDKNTTIFIENFDLIDETSLRIINDYISTLVNVEDLNISFLITVRSDYSVYKNIPKLLHSSFYKEINITKGDFESMISVIPENIEEIIDSFYFKKLEERSAGSLIYFKNLLQYLRDVHILISFENKLMINVEKTIVFPGTIKELFSMRFTSLPESEGLVIAYTILLGGRLHYSLLNKLDIENLDNAIASLVEKSLITYEKSTVEVENLRIFEPALMKALSTSVKKVLATNIKTKLKYTDYKLLKILGENTERVKQVFDTAMTDIRFGDFNSYLNCTKLYISLIDELGIKDEELLYKKNELYSILVNHLNRYPSTKVYSISKSILSSAMDNNDDETIVNVSNLILDSALNGGDYVLAEQCIHNILKRILNPQLMGENQDFTPQFLLYSCIHVKITFNLARYSQCISICDKIMSIMTNEFIDKLVYNGADREQMISFVKEILVYAALSKIIICDSNLEDFLSNISTQLGSELISDSYLMMLNKLYHLDEYDTDAGLPSDEMSTFIANILIAFKNFGDGYNIFAQNVYKAKISAQSDDMKIFSLLCDLLIGYSYQKLNLVNNVSWKKTEIIYDDVLRIAQKSGLNTLVQLTNWFKATLLKDKGLYEDAYELVTVISNSLKRNHAKNRILSLINYILTLNIASHLETKKTDIPVIVYRIIFEAEKYNLEEFYQFIEDKRVLDTDYMVQFKEAIEAEQHVIEEEEQEEAKADAADVELIQNTGIPQ